MLGYYWHCFIITLLCYLLLYSGKMVLQVIVFWVTQTVGAKYTRKFKARVVQIAMLSDLYLINR